jgi:hypothetical protein
MHVAARASASARADDEFLLAANPFAWISETTIIR